MKTQVRYKQVCCLAICSVLLLGCQERFPSVIGGAAKTRAFYAANVEQAVKDAEKCIAFEASTLSAMPPSKQQGWLETDDGISCNNARMVAAIDAMDGNRRRRSDAASKYGQPGPSLQK